MASHPEILSPPLPIEAIVYENGPNPDSYLVTEPEYQHFLDDEQTGCIGYKQDRRYLHVVGGLIAPAERKLELLQQFTRMVDQRRYLANFYSIAEEEVELFRECGYQVTKFGENSTLKLAGHSWQGKDYSWIRRQVSYVKRNGISFREIDLTTCTPEKRVAIFEKLQAINLEQLSERVLKHEIGLLEGKLYPDHFYRRRLFVAEHVDHPERWEAFVVCTPMQGGTGWATEMYRFRQDSVRGVIPFLFAQIIDTLQNQGAETVSFCMVPAINCSQPHPGDSKIARFLLGFWEKRLNFLLNAQGLYHFKSRFRPEFTPVYLCVRPGISLGSTWSFVRSVGVFQMDWRNWLKKNKSPHQQQNNSSES